MNTVRVHTRPKKADEFRSLGLIAALKQFPVLEKRWAELAAQGWQLFVVNQKRGQCYDKQKWITIPLWAVLDKEPGYWVYYTAHEMAHTGICKSYKYGIDVHGPEFQERLKQLCPIEYVHYELGYKNVQATQAGISNEHKSKAKKVDIIDILDLL